jgi:adenine-specific DNA-methyltransferase
MAELIWDGKYDEHGNKRAPVRIELPFQTVETVNESAQERQRTLELSSSGHDPEWRNRLIWGDKKYVLPSLLPEFAGKVDLIYIDPPFDTGADFSFTATVADHADAAEDDSFTFTKEPSTIELKAYRDTWGCGLDSYLRWFSDTATLLRDLLSESGSLYVHLDWHVSHYAKAILDELFGREQFRNEVIWKRTSAHANVGQRFAMVNDRIFLYTKSEHWTWNQPYVPYTADYIKSHYGQSEEDGKRRFTTRDLTASMERASSGQLYSWKGLRPPKSRCWAYTKDNMEKFEEEGRLVYSAKGMPRLKLYLNEMPGTPADDLWIDIFPINSQAEERVGYATQKPETLADRVIQASSHEGDLVLDCFIGSGTMAAVSEKLNRRWIACDLGRFAIHTTRKRLLGIPDVKPFIVQNLGKYERQQWQVAEFPSNGKDQLEEQKEREAAYRKFILELYHATPVSGHAWLHGVKAGRMVHVGAVDAPVTRADVNAIAAEVWKAAGKGANSPQKPAVDILGWEFALELNETAKEVAAQARVDAAFKKIPREVLEKKAVEQGDVHFFELGALSVETKIKKRELTLTLSDFVIPLDDVPAEVRTAIKHWSQMVDYWAVDWDFKDDTFHNQWQSYRTRKNPKLDLSVKREYPEPGHYAVVVKVIDILGNDTTKTLTIEMK